MNNESYFSQYESPNIVIVPTMSCNPSSPKRRKIGNNIVVPIVNNATWEKQKLKIQENKKSDDSNASKKVDGDLKINPPLKPSCASNQLKSIGPDKKSSNRKGRIPKKTTSNSVVTADPEPRAAQASSRSKSVKKCDKLKMSIKNKSDTNILKDSRIKTKHIGEIKNSSIKARSKQDKPAKEKSTKEKRHSNDKGDKSIKALTCKSKNVLKDSYKTKIDSTKKNVSHKQPINTCTSGMQSSHRQSTKAVDIIPPKDLSSKQSTKYLSVRYKEKSQNDVAKCNVKSSIVTQNIQDNRKTRGKTKYNQNKTDSAKTSENHSNTNCKEKQSNPKCSMGNVSAIKSAKVIKNYDISNLKKLAVLNKVEYNNELKTRIHNENIKVSNKTKSKNISRKSKNISSKTDFTSNKKTVKSPIKKKTTEAKNEIKLVINVIYNKPNPPQCNESNSSSKTCKVSNVNLDFLNDFNIDEIVESLDSCEKKSIISDIHTGYKDNTDAIDLIKTLKGEEDDDLMQISIANVQESLFRTIQTQHTGNCQNLSKNSNSQLKKNHELNLKSIEVKEKLEISSKPPQTATCDLENLTETVQINKIISTDKDEKSIENVKKSLFRTTETQATENCQNVTKTSDSQSKDNQELDLMRMEVKEKLEISEPLQTASCYATCGLENLTESSQNDKIINTGKDENTKSTQFATSNNAAELPKQVVTPESSADYVRGDALETLSDKTKLDLDNKIKDNTKVKEEQNMNSFQCDRYSLPVFNKDNFDSYKLKLQDDITINCKCLKEKLKKFDDNLLKFNEDQTKNTTLLNQTPKKVADIANVNETIDKIHSNYTGSLNLVSKELNNTDVDSFTLAVNQDEYVKKYNEVQTHIEKQNENNADSISKIITNDESRENQNDDNVTNSNNQVFPKHNDSDINVELKVENNSCQDNPKLIENDVKKAKTPDNGVEEDAHKSDKKERHDKEDFSKQKSLDISNQSLESNVSKSDKNTHGNIKTKADLETVLKLEESLYACSGSKYSITSIIHTGMFSKIFKCKHPNGKLYALKMPTKKIKYFMGKEKMQMLHFLVSDIPKNNLFIVYLTKAFNVAEKWCYLLEYYPKTLDQVMSETEKPFRIDKIQDYARQLVTAVLVLRNKNMLHLDINPKHILINSSNNLLKLCGFDRLCYINKIRVLPSTGTVNYRAPEVILGFRPGFEIDVWSTGLVLYEMAVHKKLFPGIYNNDILYKQICTLGCIPYDMIKRSRFAYLHFVGSKFMRKTGFRGQDINIISRFTKNSKLCDSIYNAYFENWGHLRSASQQNGDIGKINMFVKLLQKMLMVHPQYRLPIEYVYANQFIYDTYTY